MWNFKDYWGIKVTSDEHANAFLFFFFFLLLFQADQLMFALHFVRGMHPELFQENVSGREENLQVINMWWNINFI